MPSKFIPTGTDPEIAHRLNKFRMGRQASWANAKGLKHVENDRAHSGRVLALKLKDERLLRGI